MINIADRRGFKTKILKPKNEIPNQVRDDRKTRTEPLRHEPWTDKDQTRFSIWFAFFLPSADAPFIPVPAYYSWGEESRFGCIQGLFVVFSQT